MRKLFIGTAAIAVFIVACPLHNPVPVEPDYPPSSGVVEVFPDGSEAAAKSPCGLACENFSKLDCGEGDPTKGGVSCYRVCLHAASLRRLPTGCWARAKSRDELRACGQVTCRPH